MRVGSKAIFHRRHDLSRQFHQAASSSLQITTLPNKIRVATESTPGHFSSVGLYVDAGSRYELPSTSGVSHFLDRMAFKTTQSRTNEQMSAAIDTLGGQIMCSSSRESMMYQSTHFDQATPLALSDAGSRYELPSTSGVSHFLDRMAFKTTQSRTNEQMSAAIDTLGGQIMCSSSRESMMYQSTHFDQATPLALSLISDTVLNPSFLPDEIEAQRDAARYEIRELSAKPDMILPEILHSVAYNNKGLGNPLLCPEERISAINSPLLRSTMENWYRPERMVIAGVGMAHEELVELADKYFSSLKSTLTHVAQASQSRSSHPVPPPLLSSSSPSVYKSLTRAASSYLYPLSSNPPSDSTSVSQNPSSTYTGGYRFIPDSSADFGHLYVAFEGVGIHDDDIYALATMQVLLGGGGSFSAGGPGKGMYSRLYTHILNHFPHIDHCASFHHIYSDSSLFGLFASFVPNNSNTKGSGYTPAQILPHLIHQLSLLLYTPIPVAELSRAKNQLKSSLMMALESRAVQVEDLGRQILVHNRRIPVSEMTERIDEITPDTIRRVAERVFGPQARQATLVCMGQDEVGDWKPVLRKYGLGGV